MSTIHNQMISNSLLFSFQATKQNGSVQKFGKRWKSGDVIGCFIDISERSIGFSLNGEMMMDVSGRESAFDHFEIAQGLINCLLNSSFKILEN